MLDIRSVREHYDDILLLILSRGKGDFNLPKIQALDKKRRELLQSLEKMKNNQKNVSKQIPVLKKEGKETIFIMEEMKALSEEIKALDAVVETLELELQALMLQVPNVPAPNSPIGETEKENRAYRIWGSPKTFQYEPKAHWDIGETLNILDFERATKVTGTRFAVYKGLGARLERALYNFMLDLHTLENAYVEVLTPYMVNRAAMIGTGQLPKFEDDMFNIPSKDYFLIPTAEVSVTNLYSGEILTAEVLPIYHAALSPCFRKEAGATGRDTRGLIRQHQFNKVELVKFVKPETSYAELESLLLQAEEVLKRLGLPYRVVELCTGDLGFSSTKTYDIEVWMPSYDRYLEISSCSNFEDFQARRANIRYRDELTGKVRFVHTLNGSALAVGRTLAAILENYQQVDGTVIVPEVLRPYMGGVEVIR